MNWAHVIQAALTVSAIIVVVLLNIDTRRRINSTNETKDN